MTSKSFIHQAKSSCSQLSNSEKHRTISNVQHLEEGKNLPGDRNLYPLPAGSRNERAPGLLLVEIVGDGATFLVLEQCPLEEFLLLPSISRSSRLSGVSLGEQWRGDRFKRFSTSLVAEVRGPGAPCTALIGPRCGCGCPEAFVQKVFRLCIA